MHSGQIGCGSINIQRDYYAALAVPFFRERKGPQQLGDGQEKVTFCQVDAWANAAASTVAVVISIFEVGRGSVLGSKESAAFVAVGIEDVRTGEACWVVVQSPYV